MAIDRVEKERLRKQAQINEICNEYGYDSKNWTVITTLTPSARLYTRFSHVNSPNYFKTLKAVRQEVQRLVAEEEEAEVLSRFDALTLHPNKCGLCMNSVSVKSISLECGHVYCGECIGNYLIYTEDDVLFDHIYGLPYCPTCKTDDKHNHVSFNTLKFAFATKIIDESCMNRCRMMRKTVTK